MKSRIRVLPVVLALGALVLATAPAEAVVVLGVPGSYQVGFATPQAVTVVGGPLALVNSDTQPHNVIALTARRANGSAAWCSGYQAGKCPLFWSASVSAGEYTMVEGLADVVSGQSYQFYCSIHSRMIGTLTVL